MPQEERTRNNNIILQIVRIIINALSRIRFCRSSCCESECHGNNNNNNNLNNDNIDAIRDKKNE